MFVYTESSVQQYIVGVDGWLEGWIEGMSSSSSVDFFMDYRWYMYLWWSYICRLIDTIGHLFGSTVGSYELPGTGSSGWRLEGSSLSKGYELRYLIVP